MINIRTLFNRNTKAQEERRQLAVEVLRAQVGESVDRRRNGTTDVKSLMAQLQEGDQGDSLHTQRADECLSRWAQMTAEDFDVRIGLRSAKGER